MRKISTHFLRLVLVVISLGVLALCIFGFPAIAREASQEFEILSSLRLVILFVFYAVAVPFYFAVFQSFKLLNYIDKNTAFSDLSVIALRKIKYSGIIMSALCMLFMPLAFLVADADDAPGLILMCFALACSPFVIGVFAALLQRILQSAIEFKSENELTI